MSVIVAAANLNILHSIAEAIRKFPPTTHVTITYADGRFMVRERTQTNPLERNRAVSEEIQRMVPALFQYIASLEVSAQEDALRQLDLDAHVIHDRADLFGTLFIFSRIPKVLHTMQHQQLLGAHLPEVRKWLLCPETPPDLAYLQRHSFSPEQLNVLGRLLFKTCITHNRVQVAQRLLDQGAGVNVGIGPSSQGTNLLYAALSSADATREMAACILQHPSLTPLCSVECNGLTPLATACLNDYRDLDLLPRPKAADFRCLMTHTAPHRKWGALNRLFAKAGLQCTVSEVFTITDNGLALVTSHPLVFEVAALTGLWKELFFTYKNLLWYEQRQQLLASVAKVWAAYPDFEMSINTASDAGVIEFFSDFLSHVSNHGFVCLEYRTFTEPLRAIPCAAEPTPEQQRRSHGALMRFISDLLGYAQPSSPLDSLQTTTRRRICGALASIVYVHRRINPALSVLDWRALLHFHPVQHENLRRDFYWSLASGLQGETAGAWEPIFPITSLGFDFVPWELLQYQLGWDAATTNAMRGSTGMADTLNPFRTIMKTLEEGVHMAIARYVSDLQELPIELLPQLFIAADLLQSPRLRDAVVRRCIKDICYGDQITPEHFCRRILPILIANSSIGHPADLTELAGICRQCVVTWMAKAMSTPQTEKQLAALAIAVDHFGIDTDTIP